VTLGNVDREEDQIAGNVRREQAEQRHEPKDVDETGDETKPDGKRCVFERRTFQPR